MCKIYIIVFVVVQARDSFAYWIGGKKVGALWLWGASNLHFSEYHWTPGQPSNVGSDEICVTFEKKKDDLVLGWRDRVCGSGNKKHFICEMEMES